MARVFEMHTVMPRCPSKIESLAVWVPPPVSNVYNLLLFVGTAEGTLLVYEPSPQVLNQPAAPAPMLGISPARLLPGRTPEPPPQAAFLTFRLRMSKKRFSRKGYPVSKLQVVDKWGVLLSLSDSQISYHSLCTDPILKESNILPLGRGCTAFAVNTQIDKMCVSFKKSLVIFSWISDDGVGPAVFSVKSAQQMGKFVVEREIALGDVPQKLIWSDPGFIYVGTSREYLSISVDEAGLGGSGSSSDSRDAVRTGHRRQAVMCTLRMPPSEEVGTADLGGNLGTGGSSNSVTVTPRSRARIKKCCLYLMLGACFGTH